MNETKEKAVESHAREHIRAYNRECGWPADDSTKVRRMAWVETEWLKIMRGRCSGEALAAMNYEAGKQRELFRPILDAAKKLLARANFLEQTFSVRTYAKQLQEQIQEFESQNEGAKNDSDE